MNFLAHLFCSPDHPDELLGNFIADFVKGRVEGRFPERVANGILQHRRLDAFTDAHAVFAASRRLVSCSRRRYAGIIIDIAYDHFLALDWDRYSRLRLGDFAARAYDALRSREAPIPGTAAAVIDRMSREDWLGSYRRLDVLDRVYRRISLRLRHENPLGTAFEELERNYDALRGHFHLFFPRLLEHARDISGRSPQAVPAGRSLPSASRSLPSQPVL